MPNTPGEETLTETGGHDEDCVFGEQIYGSPGFA